MLQCQDNQLAALPALPTSLTSLYCHGNALTALPDLPPGLVLLDCHACPITVLPALPPSLASLVCFEAQLISLPALPASLVHLDCGANQLTTLPILPAGMEVLRCHNNHLTSLPALPPALYSLGCNGNDLTTLPALNDSLVYLYCYDNQLTYLPPLPASLVGIACYQNQLTSPPALPGSMSVLNCHDNQLTCLPWLPNALEHILCYGNQLTCLPNIPTAFDAGISMLGFPFAVCNVNTAPCPVLQEAITGNVFNDANGNGLKDIDDGPFHLATVEAQPDAHMTSVDGSGDFVLPMSPGTYTLDGLPVQYHTKTTDAVTISLGPLEIDSLNMIGYQAIPGIYDLDAELFVFPPRPGYVALSWLRVRNIGTETTTVGITLDFGPDQDWSGSLDSPTTLGSTNAYWDRTLEPGDEWMTTVTLYTPPTVPIDTPIDYVLSALPAMPDTTPANNQAGITLNVVGSCDPNEKVVAPLAFTPSQLSLGDSATYVIRFQNIGTHAASRVVITDTLSADLQWNTMRFISSSHPCSWYLEGGVLHFLFDPISLPDSASDEASSHGFVKFRIQPQPALLIGAMVSNVANIYFDFNAPVITPPAAFTVDDVIAVTELDEHELRILPNPAQEMITLVLDASWQGTLRADVIDLTGRLALTKWMPASHAILDITALCLGSYQVCIRDGDGRMLTGRFVKR